MTDAPPRFSLVIATRGRPSVLAETLASAARCDPRPAEVIVVDGDRARSAEPAARAAGARYERSAPGLTTQRNAGLELAEGDVVVFVDDDTELHPGLFAALADAYRDTDVLGVTGPVVDRDLRRFGNMRSRWRRVLPGGGREGSLTRYGYPRRRRYGSASTRASRATACSRTRTSRTGSRASAGSGSSRPRRSSTGTWTPTASAIASSTVTWW